MRCDSCTRATMSINLRARSIHGDTGCHRDSVVSNMHSAITWSSASQNSASFLSSFFSSRFTLRGADGPAGGFTLMTEASPAPGPGMTERAIYLARLRRVSK